jgi:hypothetical protein
MGSPSHRGHSHKRQAAVLVVAMALVLLAAAQLIGGAIGTALMAIVLAGGWLFSPKARPALLLRLFRAHEIEPAMARFLVQDATAYALIVGDGPLHDAMQLLFAKAGVADRVRFTGALRSHLLASAYKAMDVFAFASTSETQGLVLAEAMAAGTPVVALDAPGAREIVQDRVNGRLLPAADAEAFCAGVASLTALPATSRRQIAANALQSAAQLSLERCAERALTAYETMVAQPAREVRAEADETWYRTVRLLSAEWELLYAAMGAASSAFQRRAKISK